MWTTEDFETEFLKFADDVCTKLGLPQSMDDDELDNYITQYWYTKICAEQDFRDFWNLLIGVFMNLMLMSYLGLGKDPSWEDYLHTYIERWWSKCAFFSPFDSPAENLTDVKDDSAITSKTEEAAISASQRAAIPSVLKAIRSPTMTATSPSSPLYGNSTVSSPRRANLLQRLHRFFQSFITKSQTVIKNGGAFRSSDGREKKSLGDELMPKEKVKSARGMLKGLVALVNRHGPRCLIGKRLESGSDTFVKVPLLKGEEEEEFVFEEDEDSFDDGADVILWEMKKVMNEEFVAKLNISEADRVAFWKRWNDWKNLTKKNLEDD